MRVLACALAVTGCASQGLIVDEPLPADARAPVVVDAAAANPEKARVVVPEELGEEEVALCYAPWELNERSRHRGDAGAE